jgi:hypothetical protein
MYLQAEALIKKLNEFNAAVAEDVKLTGTRVSLVPLCIEDAFAYKSCIMHFHIHTCTAKATSCLYSQHG